MSEEQEEQGIEQMAESIRPIVMEQHDRDYNALIAAIQEKVDWHIATIIEVIELINWQDAMLWRALMRCPRIRMFGSANVAGYPRPESKTNPNEWVHFGAEFWSRFNGGQEHCTTNEWGYAALRDIARDILRQEGIEL